MLSFVFTYLLFMAPLEAIECPRWIGDSDVVAPPGVGLSLTQKKVNRLRCYWQVVKPAEWRCARQRPLAQCQERTNQWLTNSFQWVNLVQACEDLRNERNSNARTLMINIREVR